MNIYERLGNQKPEYYEKIVAYTEDEIETKYKWMSMRPASDRFSRADSFAALQNILQEKGGVTEKDLMDNGWYLKKDRAA